MMISCLDFRKHLSSSVLAAEGQVKMVYDVLERMGNVLRRLLTFSFGIRHEIRSGERRTTLYAINP